MEENEIIIEKINNAAERIALRIQIACNKITGKKKVIYVCSPCRGNVAANISWAKLYVELILREGHTPIAPHVFYSEFINDEDSRDREIALEAGKNILSRCDEVWVFGNHISEGMKSEIRMAELLDIPVRQASLQGIGFFPTGKGLPASTYKIVLRRRG